MSIFKSCDIRGIVNEEWGLSDAHRIGRSLGAMLRRRQQTMTCIGGDFRRSTPDIMAALTSGVVATGVNVMQIGQQPTPVAYFSTRHLACPNLAIVTASHNPGKYNGVKFMVAGQPATPELVDELEQGMDEVASVSGVGQVQTSAVLSSYEPWIIDAVRDFIAAKESSRNHLPQHAPLSHKGTTPQHVPLSQGGLQGVRKNAASDFQTVPKVGGAHFKVVLDAMGGAFTHLAQRIIRAAGHDVLAIDDQFDPDFSTRDPNPAVDRNLTPVVHEVSRHGADLGIALDGDGDRVLFVDAAGKIARPEQIAALLVRHHFHQCTMVYDLKCASIVARAVASHGGRAIMQPSGHGFIKSMMLQQQAEIGVEVSGHHFFGVLDGGDDGLFTALVVLQLLEKTGQSLSELLKPIGWPAITPDIRIRYAGNIADTLDAIATHCGGTVTRLDGVRTEYSQGGWALARASITEPAITFRFEGRDRDDLHAIASRFFAGLPDLGNQVMEKIDV